MFSIVCYSNICYIWHITWNFPFLSHSILACLSFEAAALIAVALSTQLAQCSLFVLYSWPSFTRIRYFISTGMRHVIRVYSIWYTSNGIYAKSMNSLREISFNYSRNGQLFGVTLFGEVNTSLVVVVSSALLELPDKGLYKIPRRKNKATENLNQSLDLWIEGINIWIVEIHVVSNARAAHNWL